jgi:hypothetical protein
MANEHSKRKHSDFAASASHRWLHCPGSVALVKKAPPQKFESKYAIEGTHAHECLEFIVKRFSNLEKAAKEAAKNEKWNAEMIAHAVKSAKTIFALKPSKTAKLLIETRVVLHSIGKDLFGTLDYAWVDEWGTLVVIDYKYGSGVPVLPIDDDTGEPNPQLMYYALGLAHKYNFEFEKVRLAIVQPRVWREDEDPLTEGTVTIKKLREFEKLVKEAVALARRPNAPLKATTEGCRWCQAASFCPQVSTGQMEAAGIAFDVETGVEKLPEIEVIGPDKIGKVLDACDLLETWIEKVRAHAFALAVDGEKIEGRKLVAKRSIRAWLPEAEAKAVKAFGLDAFSKPSLLSPAQLEKVIGKEAKPFTEQYTSNVSSGFSLVPAKDKRPEVLSTIAFDLDEAGA